MASITRPLNQPDQTADEDIELPPLEAGDHLDRQTFHERYAGMQTRQKFELIGGVVYMASPAKPRHGRIQFAIIGCLFDYERATPGTQGLDNTSNIIDDENEPQPDACLIVLPEKGGQTREEDGWLVGVPEFVAEVASSTEAYDLHSKKRTYQDAGVKEYVVVALRQKRVFWFIAREGKLEELPPGPDGIIRSEVFPGLWIDPVAVVQRNTARLTEVLKQGLSSPEHAAFVARLANYPGS